MKMFAERRGNVSIPVYSAGAGRWEVRYRLHGKIQRPKFPTKKAASLHAQEIAGALANGDTFRLTITRDEAYDWIKAKAILEGVGKSILQVAFEERERYQTGQALRDRPGPLVAVAVQKFLEAQRARDLSAYYLRDLKCRLGIFAASFKESVNFLKAENLSDWINALKKKSRKAGQDPANQKPISVRTRNNYRSALEALFAWCKETKLLPPDWNELRLVPPIKIKSRSIPIFTTSELTDLLAGASRRMLPALALGAFAGLRTEEIMRVTWSAINWDKNVIYLRREVTKTNRSRLVPLRENLRAWLEPWQNESGRICDYAGLACGKAQLAHKLGLVWKRNALRHSYISYRLAEIQNIAQVALEAGNSPGVIHESYLELVTVAEARKWFEIRPQSVPTNLLNLKFA